MKTKKEVRQKSAVNLKLLISTGLLGLAVIFLFLAQSGYWINHTVFNQQSFTEITTSSIQEESSRKAISRVIVNRALEDRPVVQRVAGERAESLISGLLASDLSNQAINALSVKTYQYANSSDRKDVAVNLESIKEPLSRVLAVSQKEEAVQRVENLPDQIVLLEKDTFPDLSGFVITMLWLTPLLWLLTLCLFGGFILMDKKHYAKRVYYAGAAILLTSLFGYLTSPYIPSPIAAAIPTIEIRPLAENLISGYLKPFQGQMLFMMALIVSSLVVFNQRFNIARLFRSVGKVNK